MGVLYWGCFHLHHGHVELPAAHGGAILLQQSSGKRGGRPQSAPNLSPRRSIQGRPHAPVPTTTMLVVVGAAAAAGTGAAVVPLSFAPAAAPCLSSCLLSCWVGPRARGGGCGDVGGWGWRINRHVMNDAHCPPHGASIDRSSSSPCSIGSTPSAPLGSDLTAAWPMPPTRKFGDRIGGRPRFAIHARMWWRPLLLARAACPLPGAAADEESLLGLSGSRRGKDLDRSRRRLKKKNGRERAREASSSTKRGFSERGLD